MKILKHSALYAGLLLSFGSVMYFLLHTGKIHFPDTTTTVMEPANIGNRGIIENAFHSNIRETLPILLLQIIIIIASTQFLGNVFKKIGQPAVIGETVAGIILGPSLLGLLFPGAFQFIFPVESLSNLRFLSQIGLILFMFIVGMELDTGLLRKQAFEALVISHAGIIIPFTFGVGLSLYLYQHFASGHSSFISFALFMGIAMSITAFPVLARIIRDRKMTQSKLGIIAMSCAASDDVTAWCILGLLIAVIRSGTGVNGLWMIGLVILYALFMLFPVKILLNRIQFFYNKGRMADSTWIATLFILLLFSAYCTEVIGIHALFGAFLAGIIMPKNEVTKNKIIDRISDISTVMLLPLFFVYTGLRTHIGILNSADLWIVFFLILFCAVAGKFGGSALVARALGQSWRDSLSIGALMNTRGLMELVVLNIGYDMGILSNEIFSLMVLMALLTTLMTSPILNWVERRFS